MDSTQMEDMILDLVTTRRTVSFAEIMEAIGAEARGDLSWEIAPNTVLWSGMSPSLMNAFESLKGKIEPHPTSVLVYLHDGAGLRLPVAKRITRKGYTEPHWLPVVFNPKPAATHK